MNNNKQITILGAGAWGTTLAYLLAQNNHDYCLWSRSSKDSLASIVTHSDIIISAISMKGVKSLTQQISSIDISPETIIVTATKGLDTQSYETPSKIWQQAFPDNPIVVLCGPNLSPEIKAGLPAATVVASEDRQAAELIQQVFATDTFRVYVNNDPIGTELGGTLKNIMAIASGVCDGLNLGTNAKAALLTRALPEIIRVGCHLGGSMDTFFGLSGLGDLLATCDSPLSRNYQVGSGLAEGKSLEQILDHLQGTAEGVNTVNVLIKLAKREQIPVPIAYQVYLLLQGEITPQKAVENLMARELKQEFYS